MRSIARSDIFSLGIILYELSTGYRLFRRDSQQQVIEAVTSEPIRTPTSLRPELPMFLERCILKALERDPRDRYRNAALMRDDLLQLLAMMSKGSERDDLGEYVASLFVDERKDIAETLRKANQGMLELGGGDSTVMERLEGEFSPFEEETMELEAADLAIDALRNKPPLSQKPRKKPEEPELPSEKFSAGGASDQRAAELEQEHREAVAQAGRLTGEVRALQRRQTLLMIIILILFALAAVLGVLQFQASAQASENVEVSSSE